MTTLLKFTTKSDKETSTKTRLDRLLLEEF